MKSSITHSVYGRIDYIEGLFLGKKSLFVNGVPLEKLDKKTYILRKEKENVLFQLKGSFLLGAKLVVGKEEIQLTPPIKWYETALSVFIFVFIIAWSNSIELCSIIPVVGGAIGGAISGVMIAFNIIVMRLTKKLWLKLLIWLAFFVATFAICYAVAMLIIVQII